MADPTAQSKETPKAAQAFADYVALGSSRSLRALAEHYVYQNYYKTIGTATATVSRWSMLNHWQERLTTASTAHSDQLLKQSAEIDADTFLKSSRRLNDDMGTQPETEVVIKIRESVRKPAPKGGTSVSVGVNVTLTIEQRQMVERIAASRGLDVGEVMDELHGILGLTGS